MLEEQALAPSSTSCQCCYVIDRTFLPQSTSYRSPLLKKGPHAGSLSDPPTTHHTGRCQPVTNVREPFSSQFPSLSKGQINEECLHHNVVYQTPQTLCEEDSLVAEATVLRLPGILSAPGITLYARHCFAVIDRTFLQQSS